ncbi:hypothetical protein DL93DRAFT_2069044, partial [Clavulina sp. PMI_390]
MLSRLGVSNHDKGITLTICDQCHSSLASTTRSRIPKHSLKNSLYRGYLPERFRDLTWIEEQVCAKYRSTAFVTRLHHVNDPKHPYVLHGNTCAFEQDILSTAKVLPRAPSDLEDCLSVIFTGPNRDIPQAALKKIFRIWKPLVIEFLRWLCSNNVAYADVEINENILDLYNGDGMIPEFEDHVIY